jgi:hypothetical protein
VNFVNKKTRCSIRESLRRAPEAFSLKGEW